VIVDVAVIVIGPVVELVGVHVTETVNVIGSVVVNGSVDDRPCRRLLDHGSVDDHGSGHVHGFGHVHAHELDHGSDHDHGNGNGHDHLHRAEA
jgi:hypothetical protein